MDPNELKAFITKLTTEEDAIEAKITELQEKEELNADEIDGLEALSMLYGDAASILENLLQNIEE